MFITRLISGIILVAIALLFICTGGDVLLAVMLVLSLIGMFELYRIFKVEKSLPGILGYLACITYYLDLRFKFCQDVMVIVLAFLILLLAVFVFSYPKFHSHQIMAVFFGLFYVGVMLSFVLRIRMLPGGEYLAFLVFLWIHQISINDSIAMLFLHTYNSCKNAKIHIYFLFKIKILFIFIACYI